MTSGMLTLFGPPMQINIFIEVTARSANILILA